MLVDWLTLRYELKTLADIELRNRLAEGRRNCIMLEDDELITEWWPREKKRSDSHKLSVSLTTGSIVIDGSPTRAGQDNNVFGSDDPQECAHRMIRAVAAEAGVILPQMERWKVTRIDLTQNYDCGPHVREALESLRQTSGGHLKATAFNETAYWNQGSTYWRAKAYAKGPHLAKQVRKGKATATEEEIELAHRLVRFEVTLGGHYLRENQLDLRTLTKERATMIYEKLAGKIIPQNAEITSEQQFAEALVALYGKRKAKTLLGTWAIVKANGEQGAISMGSRATWYRQKKLLCAAGLSKADLSARTVVAFRPKAIVARPVDSWADLRRAA